MAMGLNPKDLGPGSFVLNDPGSEIIKGNVMQKQKQEAFPEVLCFP